MWIAPKPLILASKSEVRRRILAAAGLPVEVRPAGIDERGIEARSNAQEPADVARVLSGAKAHTIAAQMPARLVLGADQTLALGEQRFSKPIDRAAAREQLRALSGKTHRLYSAITLVRDGSVLFEHVDTEELTMRALSDAFIDRYLDAVGAGLWPVSAATRSKASASICSRRFRATTTQFWGCLCCRCSNFCAKRAR